MAIHRERVRKAQELMERNNIDALFILNHDNFLYFFREYRHQPRAIIPRQGDPIVIVSRGEIEDAKASLGVQDVRSFGGLAEQMKVVVSTLKELGLSEGRIGFEMGFGTPAFLLERFQKANPKVEIVDGSPVYMPLRMIKEADEIELMRKAAEIAVLGMEKAVEVVKEGCPENEVAAEMEYVMRKAGAEGTAVPTFVNSGPRSLWIHGRATHKEIEKGELVVLNVVPVYHGYCANLARTFVVGEPSVEQSALFEAYRRAQEAAREQLRPGVRPRDLDRAAEKMVRAAGYGEYFVRGFSHAIGLAFEEPPMPTIFPQHTSMEIKANMVVTLGHPVLAVPGVGGVRIEDTFLVTEEGAEALTEFPRQLISV